MRLNLKEKIKDYRNEVIKDEKEKELDWEGIVLIALNTPDKDEVLKSEDKNKAFQISTKIVTAKDEVELTVEQVAFIIARIDKIYNSPLICGKAKEFFNQEPKKDE